MSCEEIFLSGAIVGLTGGWRYFEWGAGGPAPVSVCVAVEEIFILLRYW